MFIGLRKDQLGARLLMMMNCVRLADHYQTNYRINWFPKGAAAPKLANPVELFTQDYMDEHFVDQQEFELMSENIAPLRKFLQDENPNQLEAHLASGKHILLDEGFEVLTFAWEDAEEIRRNCEGYLRHMGLQRALLDKMETIDTAMLDNGARTVAYHIRRGDILNEAPWRDGIWPAKIEPDELYSRHLEATNNELALVFSDQPECITRFQQKHENVRSIDEIVDLKDCLSCQCDFLELYTMSLSGKIIAPVISAFSSAAARLSGRERQRFVDVLDWKQINEAYDDVVKRFEVGHEKFVNLSEAAHIYSKLARHLAINDREQEAYTFSRNLLDAGADNAFLPMLHAINCIYLSRWEEGENAIDSALSSPSLWKEHFAISLAVKSHILGALGRADEARHAWLLAFWQKPLLPDVGIYGTYLLDNNRLKPIRDIPFDKNALNALRMPYSQRNVLTSQGKIFGRRALDFSTLVIDWPYFVLDRKAQRLLEDKQQLKAIDQAFLRKAEETKNSPSLESFRGLIQAYLGDHEAALKLTRSVIEGSPNNLLFRKRYAEALWFSGKHQDALEQFSVICEKYPNNRYGLFLMGHYLAISGEPKQALPFLEASTTLDSTSAAMHNDLAEIYLVLGKKNKAAEAFGRASELAPTFKKFKNQQKRLLA